MGKTIYFAKYDAPKQWKDPIFPKYSGEKIGEWVCNSPLVEKGWFTGSTPFKEGESLCLNLNMIFKDGGRMEFIDRDPKEGCEERLIQQAEEYISNYNEQPKTL